MSLFGGMSDGNRADWSNLPKTVDQQILETLKSIETILQGFQANIRAQTIEVKRKGK